MSATTKKVRITRIVLLLYSASANSRNGYFFNETLVILETAFDEAWITLKSNGSATIKPDELARRICHLAMEGERDAVRLHDRRLGS